MTLTIQKSLDEQIQEKALEWGQAMLAALRAHQKETKAQLEHKRARQAVLKVEDEMRELKSETMRLNIHTALAKPVQNGSILSPITVHET